MNQQSLLWRWQGVDDNRGKTIGLVSTLSLSLCFRSLSVAAGDYTNLLGYGDLAQTMQAGSWNQFHEICNKANHVCEWIVQDSIASQPCCMVGSWVQLAHILFAENFFVLLTSAPVVWRLRVRPTQGCHKLSISFAAQRVCWCTAPGTSLYCEEVPSIHSMASDGMLRSDSNQAEERACWTLFGDTTWENDNRRKSCSCSCKKLFAQANESSPNNRDISGYLARARKMDLYF